MNDAYSVLFLFAILIALVVAKYVISHWMTSRTCENMTLSLKGATVGHCPKCHSIHPEAVQRNGFHDFWTSFVCPECNYGITLHIDPKRSEDM
jgi:transposase-like protein